MEEAQEVAVGHFLCFMESHNHRIYRGVLDSLELTTEELLRVFLVAGL